jgi:hypothetical protein
MEMAGAARTTPPSIPPLPDQPLPDDDARHHGGSPHSKNGICHTWRLPSFTSIVQPPFHLGSLFFVRSWMTNSASWRAASSSANSAPSRSSYPRPLWTPNRYSGMAVFVVAVARSAGRLQVTAAVLSDQLQRRRPPPLGPPPYPSTRWLSGCRHFDGRLWPRPRNEPPDLATHLGYASRRPQRYTPLTHNMSFDNRLRRLSDSSPNS